MSSLQIPGWSDDREERWRTRTGEGWTSWLGRNTLSMKEWTIGQLDRLTSSLSTIRGSGDIHTLKLEVRTSSSCGVRVGGGQQPGPWNLKKRARKLPVVSAGGEMNTPISKQRVDAGGGDPVHPVCGQRIGVIGGYCLSYPLKHTHSLLPLNIWLPGIQETSGFLLESATHLLSVNAACIPMMKQLMVNLNV